MLGDAAAALALSAAAEAGLGVVLVRFDRRVLTDVFSVAAEAASGEAGLSSAESSATSNVRGEPKSCEISDIVDQVLEYEVRCDSVFVLLVAKR